MAGRKVITAKAKRLAEARERIAARSPKGDDLAFQHTVLCQTSLPHRPTTARVWEREQGNVSLRIEAGGVNCGPHGWRDMPLPHGEKPRLILIHLNREAVRTDKRIIELGPTMTAFARDIGIEPNGAHIRDFWDQMVRLSVMTVRLAVSGEDRIRQNQMHLADGLELYDSRDGNRAWPTRVRLSEPYFRGLRRHAVPLDMRAIGALQHSSLCLDLYCWLAQRLYRIETRQSQRISWTALKEQFGPDYARERAFRAKFILALEAVCQVYPKAEMEWGEGGLTLYRSPPPVPERVVKGRLLI